MEIVAKILIGFVALQHIGFLILEMFLWDKPLGRKIFRTKLEYAQSTKSLAANQGLYNGFLAAGLVWSLFVSNAHFSTQLQIFFLSCVIVAGIYGMISVSKNILFVQAIPALIALICVLV